jgi:hypothetical protein
MKMHRWFPGLALVIALLLGACAPPNQGAGESSTPGASQSAAPESEAASPTETAEPMESESAESSAPPTPYDY